MLTPRPGLGPTDAAASSRTPTAPGGTTIDYPNDTDITMTDDDPGRRISRAHTAGTWSWTYGQPARLQRLRRKQCGQAEPALGARPQALLAGGLSGNMTSDGVWQYTWNDENHLTSVESSAGVPPADRLRLEFTYDGQGRRCTKHVYTWDAQAETWALTREHLLLYDQPAEPAQGARPQALLAGDLNGNMTSDGVWHTPGTTRTGSPPSRTRPMWEAAPAGDSCSLPTIRADAAPGIGGDGDVRAQPSLAVHDGV